MNSQSIKEETIAIGSRRELFIDDFLTARQENMLLQVHAPQAHTPEPTQPIGSYMTMLQQDGRIRAYCRKSFFEYTGPHPRYVVKPGFVNDYTAFFMSEGGVKWLEPPLFRHDCGVPNVLNCLCDETHNFAPFYDDNPACPPEERYKALANEEFSGNGLAIRGFVSADGISFRKLEEPLIRAQKEWGYCFDSQNVAFWSEAEGCYVCYFRLNVMPDGRRLRTICKATSPDFRHWGNFTPQDVNLGNEHLYVSQLTPYPRAKHIYIGTPTRYCEARGSVTDIALIFSRGGGPIQRPLKEAWIRPGPDAVAWTNRHNYLARGIVQTSPSEISLYHSRSQTRYTLRTDGFASLHAGYATGEWLSKPLVYAGGTLEFNVATSAYGSFRVELQHADGTPVSGHTLQDSREYYGDVIEYHPDWNGKNDLPFQPGEVFRLRCVARECDLYSMRIGDKLDPR